jgi:drug/metabolite transporter (DMT)-like permease
MSSESKVLAYVAFATVSFVWGTTYLAIAVAIETLPTLLFPGMRFVLGGTILLLIRLAQGGKLPTKRSDWRNLAVVGLLMVGVGNVAVVWAEHHVSSGFAALLVATAPLWMASLERMRKSGERFSGRKLAGLLIGFSGVAILVGPELGADELNVLFLVGVIVTQLGTIGWDLGSIISKYHLSVELDPLVSASLQMIFGGLIVGTLGLANGEAAAMHFTTRSLTAFLYLVVFGSVIAYGAYVYALSKLPTSVVSLYAYINPVVAVYLGSLILDEKVTANAIIGMLVIFAGVAMVQKRKGKGEAPASPPVTNAGEA